MDSKRCDPKSPRGTWEFRTLFDQYYRPIFNFFANRGFDAEDCCELTQETFLAAYASRESFRGDSRVETWIFSIAKNVWRRIVRDRNREKRKAEEISLDELMVERPLETVTENPLQRVLEEERIRLMRNALEELPELMHACVVLRIDQGLSYNEIAVAMRISVNKVKTQLFQARAKLKRRLAKHFEEIEI